MSKHVTAIKIVDLNKNNWNKNNWNWCTKYTSGST